MAANQTGTGIGVGVVAAVAALALAYKFKRREPDIYERMGSKTTTDPISGLALDYSR